jgi:hypothetical protein
MKTRQRLLTLLMLLALLLAACGGGAESFDESVAEEPMAPPGDVLEAEESGGGEGFGFDGSDAPTTNTTIPQGQPGEAQERLIIRTGQLDIVVADTEATMRQIERLVNGAEGWVVSSNVYQYSSAKSGTITVRFPADQYGSMLDQIKELAVEVSSETTNSQDVTEEFVDLSARLANLEATRDRVRTFLDEARNVEEALAVNQELSRLEGEIEAIKGRLQYLSQSAAFSSLTINLTPDILSQPIEVAGWRPQGVAREAIEDLVQALQGLTNFAIRVVLFVLPMALVLGLPTYAIIRLARRFWRRRTDPLTPPLAPPPA